MKTTTIKLEDGTVIKSRKCAACKAPMCFSGSYYYCSNKECSKCDEAQKDVENSDILVRGTGGRLAVKPMAMVGPWCGVAIRRRKCVTCGKLVYLVTTSAATVTVCKCGVAVGAN